MSGKGLDELKQKMNQDGIKEQQLLQEVDHFTKCPMCNDPLSRQNPPDLFDCGHVSCSDCSKKQFCAKCNRDVKVTSKNYTVLFDYFDVAYEATEASITYNFNIRQFKVNRSQHIIKVAPETTIQQLMMKSVDFPKYLSFKKEDTGCIICGKGVLYKEYKMKTIAEIVKEDKINLLPSSAKRANQIIFYDYSIGGE